VAFRLDFFCRSLFGTLVGLRAGTGIGTETGEGKLIRSDNAYSVALFEVFPIECIAHILSLDGALDIFGALGCVFVGSSSG
jgi:hypothetical protein